MDISFQISGNIGGIKFLPVPLYIIKLRIRTSMNDFPNIVIVFQFLLPLFDILFFGNKRTVETDLMKLP